MQPTPCKRQPPHTLRARCNAAGAVLLASAALAHGQGAFPPIVELGDLLSINGGDGSEGFVIAQRREEGLGLRVRHLGDINDDGLDDFGACEDFGGGCYVYFGRQANLDGGFPPEQALEQLFPAQGGDGTQGFALLSPQLGGNSLGQSTIAGPGDLNGDGIDDIVVGEPVSDGLGRRSAGVVYVLYGRPAGTPFAAIEDLRNLLPLLGGDGSTGFTLHGSQEDEIAGTDVAPAGDVNGDGRPDLLIAGDRRAYVIFGRDTPPDDVAFAPIIDLRLIYPGAGGDGSVGAAFLDVADEDFDNQVVDRAGDVNGDGIDDFLIDGSVSIAQSMYLVYGRDVATEGNFPALSSLSDLAAENGGDGSAGVQITALDDDFITARAAGDVNGDGLGDIIVGAAGADPDGLDRAGSV